MSKALSAQGKWRQKHWGVIFKVKIKVVTYRADLIIRFYNWDECLTAGVGN